MGKTIQNMNRKGLIVKLAPFDIAYLLGTKIILCSPAIKLSGAIVLFSHPLDSALILVSFVKKEG